MASSMGRRLRSGRVRGGCEHLQPQPQTQKRYYKPEAPEFMLTNFSPDRKMHCLRVCKGVKYERQLLDPSKKAIPRSFIDKYVQHLDESVTLKVPNGDRWTLRLDNQNGSVYFGSGWKNFLEHYLVSPDYGIRFRMGSNSTFSIVIFDQRDSEVQYSIMAEDQNNGFSSPKRKEGDEDVSCEMVGNFTPRRTTRQSTAAGPERNGPSREASYPTQRSEAPEEEIRNQPLPCYFIKLSGAYLYKSPNVPYSFVTAYGISNDQTVKLRHLGRSWAVKFANYTSLKRARLHGGWRKFASDNNLQVGDTLRFELVKRHDLEFIVTVFNGNGQYP